MRSTNVQCPPSAVGGPVYHILTPDRPPRATDRVCATVTPVTLLDFFDFDGAVLLGAADGGFQDLLRLPRILEVGHGDYGGLAAEHAEYVGREVYEGVLVADNVRIGPPGFGVGVVAAVGTHDPGPPLDRAGLGAVKVIQPVHVLEVEHDRALLPVDLHAVLVLVS